MCGICGIVTVDEPQPDFSELIAHMTAVMTHRGPDEDGFYYDSYASLGARRLSIIDLAGGRQPIFNEDRSLVIIFNGEIYNHRDLRLFLEKRGHCFRTASDTEVILHLYEEFGSDSVQHLDGIFAFAIWDANNLELLLARDRMGIKPLYYTQLGSRLVFGSEMKVLLAHPNVKREIDLLALNEYLSFEYVPSPRTIVRNVHRLEAGHLLHYTRQGLSIRQYWAPSLARSESRPPVHWRDYAADLYKVLDNSVKRELISDVPVGVLLSGGIDSSSIAALMAKHYPGKVNSFSIGFEENSFDESPYARLVAQHVGTEHHELILTSKMAAEMVPTIADYLDEPLGDSSFIPTFLLSRFARQKVKVVLGGDGGDELFAGYPTLVAHRLIEYYEKLIPWTLRASLIPRLLDRMPVSFNNISLDFRIRRLLAGRGVPLQVRHHRWLGSFVDEEKASLLQDWIKPVLSDTYAQAYAHAASCDARLPLNELLYADMKLYLEGDILFKVDRASMANSLEVRVPFLNREVVRFATGLPLELKLHRLTGKYLLKKSMQGVLPSSILKRPKKGFNMPVAYWVTGELRDLVEEMLSTQRLERQGFFNHSYIRLLLDEHQARRKDNRKLIWTLLMFQLWYATYVEKL
jgi:asparagine synthase (glutamine-hydrolysing)